MDNIYEKAFNILVKECFSGIWPQKHEEGQLFTTYDVIVTNGGNTVVSDPISEEEYKILIDAFYY